jgi:hypothetical protein
MITLMCSSSIDQVASDLFKRLPPGFREEDQDEQEPGQANGAEDPETARCAKVF